MFRNAQTDNTCHRKQEKPTHLYISFKIEPGIHKWLPQPVRGILKVFKSVYNSRLFCVILCYMKLFPWFFVCVNLDNDPAKIQQAANQHGAKGKTH